MARVGQFKALGSALGGYKKTLADVQSKDYAKRYADVRAQEQVSLYNEIGGTVANIIGIAQEKKLSKELDPLDKPERPDVPIESQSPDALEGVDIVKGKEVDFSPDLSMEKLEMRGPGENVVGSIDPPPSEMMPRAGLDTLIQESQSKPGMTNAEKQFKVLDETKELYEQTLSSDDKAFNAMNTYETGIGPNVGQKTAVSDIMSSTESQGFFDSSTGQFVKEASPSRTPTGEAFTGGHYGGKVFRDNEDFTRTKMGEIPGLYGGRESTRTGKAFDVTRQYDFVDTAGDTTTYDVTGRSDTSQMEAEKIADDNALVAAIQGKMSDFSIAKPDRPSSGINDYKKPMSPDPMTDDMVMDSIKDVSLGDFDMSKLPSVDPVRDSVLNKFKASGASDKKIEQLLNEFAAVETGFDKEGKAGQNIRQITNEDISAGRTIGTGPGAGIFQFEGAEGSNEFKTALQRMKNMYDPSRNISGMEGAKYPKWIDKALKDGNPMNLTKDQQKSLLLANLFMKEGSDSLLQKGFSSGDFSKLYTDMHYAGATNEKERREKIRQYKKRSRRLRQ